MQPGRQAGGAEGNSARRPARQRPEVRRWTGTTPHRAAPSHTVQTDEAQPDPHLPVPCGAESPYPYGLHPTVVPPPCPPPPHLAHHVRECQHGAVGVPPEQLRHDGAVGRLVPRLVARDQAAQLGQRPVAVILRQPGGVAVRDARGALLGGGTGSGRRGHCQFAVRVWYLWEAGALPAPAVTCVGGEGRNMICAAHFLRATSRSSATGALLLRSPMAPQRADRDVGAILVQRTPAADPGPRPVPPAPSSPFPRPPVLPHLEAGVHEAQVGVVLQLGVQAAADEALDGALHSAHVNPGEAERGRNLA